MRECVVLEDGCCVHVHVCMRRSGPPRRQLWVEECEEKFLAAYVVYTLPDVLVLIFSPSYSGMVVVRCYYLYSSLDFDFIPTQVYFL